jgi:uncharacterized OsmC-like protein
MISEVNTMNGIALADLQGMMTTLQQHPERAQYTFKARNHWVNGTHNRALVQDFFGNGQEQHRDQPRAFEEDEPPILLGQDAGTNPVEYVLVALSGCLTTSLVAYAAAHGVALRSVESQLEGDLDVRGFLGLAPEVRNGYQHIRVTFHIDSDAPDETLQELVTLAQQHSPVFEIVTHPVPVTVGYIRKQD